MNLLLEFARKPMVRLILVGVVGFALGLFVGWVVWPVEWTDATPAYLRPELQADYVQMAADSFMLHSDPNRALQRWAALGAAGPDAYQSAQASASPQERQALNRYGQFIESVGGFEGSAGGSQQPPPSSAPWLRYLIIGGGIIAVLVIVAAAVYLLRPRRRGAPESPAMRAQSLSRETEKTDFSQLGLAAPLTQSITTYVLGDDLYDESFSIDSPSGEFLGEYGVGISETIGVGEPKKVSALEVWLFDKNDIKTATKVLLSEHAYNDMGIRQRLEAKGDLVLIAPQQKILLETATLQLMATVVEMEYGGGPLPENSYFERVTLELAVWQKEQGQGQA